MILSPFRFVGIVLPFDCFGTKYKKPAPGLCFAGTGSISCGATLLGALRAHFHIRGRTPVDMPTLDHGVSAPSYILRAHPRRFRSPSEVHSTRCVPPRSQHPRLSGETGRVSTHSSSSVFCIIAYSTAFVKCFFGFCFHEKKRKKRTESSGKVSPKSLTKIPVLVLILV